MKKNNSDSFSVVTAIIDSLVTSFDQQVKALVGLVSDWMGVC